MRLLFIPVLFVATFVPFTAFSQDRTDASQGMWQEFRGAGGLGLAPESRIPLEWSPKEINWETDLPGRGWSSPVIVDDEIWLTTAVEATSETKAVANGGQVHERVQLKALCLDRMTGSLRFTIDLFDVETPPVLHTRNSFASPTPVVCDDRVICSFGTMGTAAIDRKSGSVIWKNEELVFDHETGPGSSPIRFGDAVIVNCDGTDRQFVVSLDGDTGSVNWRTNRSGELHENGMMQKAFSTPILIERNGDMELVSAGANWVYGYSPEDGQERWKVPYGDLGFSNVPRPIYDGQKLYVSSGFMKPRLIAWDLSERGTPKKVWEYVRNVPTIPSPILVKDRIYMVSDQGIVTCLKTEDGSEIYRERLKGNFASSPVLIGERLLFCNDDGVAYWLPASDRFEVLAENDLGSAIMATPAVVDNQLIVRTLKGLVSVGSIIE
ncbi:MAG: PQQ-binding-like beta-propeller repeat protein [Pirellulaceae bacterium]